MLLGPFEESDYLLMDNPLVVLPTMLLFFLFVLLLPKTEPAAEAFATFIQDSQKSLREHSIFSGEGDPWKLFSDNFSQTDIVYNNNTTSAPPLLTHFVFLVHGFRGHSKDLGYVKSAMKRTAELYNTTETRLILHSVSCNEKKTDDGVRNGGERLLQEMYRVMKQYPSPNRTVSILGNSLGGLYARYAIAKLPSDIPLNVFCTTATPHLGIAGHTWVKLPRSAEIGISGTGILGETGKDLFRINGLLADMAQSPYYLEPLRRFSKRLLYANAYGTDFPVPASTAAFLHGTSNYPHRILNVQQSLCIWTPGIHECDLAKSVYNTKTTAAANPNEATTMGNGDDDELARMSMCLDSLGWKKTFVDLRKHLPKLPFARLDERIIDKDVLGSKEVAHHVKPSYVHLPNAHNKIVAFSRSPISRYLNKAGRPVVDDLAKEVVHDIFSFEL